MELLERDSQLLILNECLANVEAGSGRIALVSGEAGIGKTTLIEEFIRPHQNSVSVLWGICDSLFTPRPLGPLHDMSVQIGSNISELLASNADRTAIFSAVLNYLVSQTTIIVFEDVHWADEGTLDLLLFLGRRIKYTLAFLILTYRDDELRLDHPLRVLLGDLSSSSVTQRILLSPFSEQAVRTLIGEQVIDASDLHQRTGGNPFFVTEVLASQVSGIPATIRDAVLARVARLSPDAKAVVEAAAVIGSSVDLWLLDSVTSPSAIAVEECLSTGILLQNKNSLAFRHELSRNTILNTLSPHRKLLLHRKVLDALASSPEGDERLAEIVHHAEAIGDYESVLKYAPPAARQASSQWAHREAAALYALALRFGDHLPPAEHALMLELYARECNLTERQSAGISALRKAMELWIELGDLLKQGEVLSFLAIILRNHGNNKQAEIINQSAIEHLESLPASQELALAYRVQATLRLADRDTDEALLWGKKAIEIAERHDALNILATAHVIVGAALLFLDYERGCAYLERQLRFGWEHWHERYIANLYVYIGSCSVELYRLENAEVYLDDGITYTSERGMELFNRYMQAWLALAHIHRGRWDEAAEILSQTSQQAARSVFSRIPTLVATGLLRARRGDPGVKSVLDEALDLAEPTGALSQLGLVRCARAEFAWLLGDHQWILDEVRSVYDLAVNKRHPWFTGELALWGLRAGADFAPPDWTAAPFRMQIAGDWRAAARAWERLGCLYKKAEALADGDVSAKTRALEIFESLGARPAADALRKNLRTAGIKELPQRPHPSTRDNPFGLTNRQVEILSLLVENLSNAEIAARLHISPKTVDHHVSAVLSQLGVHSRENAAERALEHPHFQEK